MNAPQIKMSKGVSIKKRVEYEVFPYPLRHSKLSLAFHTADLGAMRYITLHENQGSRAYHVAILYKTRKNSWIICIFIGVV